jgi:hypothetical protein
MVIILLLFNLNKTDINSLERLLMRILQKYLVIELRKVEQIIQLL